MEMRVPTKLENKTSNRVRNLTIHRNLKVTPLNKKVVNSQLRQFGCECRMDGENGYPRRTWEAKVEGRKARRPKKYETLEYKGNQWARERVSLGQDQMACSLQNLDTQWIEED